MIPNIANIKPALFFDAFIINSFVCFEENVSGFSQNTFLFFVRKNLLACNVCC